MLVAMLVDGVNASDAPFVLGMLLVLSGIM
jgi:hypothetical protein